MNKLIGIGLLFALFATIVPGVIWYQIYQNHYTEPLNKLPDEDIYVLTLDGGSGEIGLSEKAENGLVGSDSVIIIVDTPKVIGSSARNAGIHGYSETGQLSHPYRKNYDTGNVEVHTGTRWVVISPDSITIDYIKRKQ